jgi:hypothetical protein
VTFIFLTFYLELASGNASLIHSPFPLTHTNPGDVRRQPKQMMGKKVSKDLSWISTSNENAFGHKNLLYSFPLSRGCQCQIPTLQLLFLACVPRIPQVG